MPRLSRLIPLLLLVSALLATSAIPSIAAFALSRPFATSPALDAVASYSVLAGSTVTNTGPTTVSADLGVSPGSAVTGILPANVGGTIHVADAHAAAAQADNIVAFGALDQPCDATYASGQDLTLLSPLAPGVYCTPGSFALSGNLALSGSGVWIFISGSTLITAPGASVTGGDPCNVWWRVGSSATLDTGTAFIGNILALASITMNTNASLNGRALAQTGAVTMQTNAVSLVCANEPGATATNTPLPAGTSTPPANTPAATPTLIAPPSPPANTPAATPTLVAPLTPTPTVTSVSPTDDSEVDEPSTMKRIFLPIVGH